MTCAREPLRPASVVLYRAAQQVARLEAEADRLLQAIREHRALIDGGAVDELARHEVDAALWRNVPPDEVATSGRRR